jgi:hypothetical protein
LHLGGILLVKYNSSKTKVALFPHDIEHVENMEKTWENMAPVILAVNILIAPGNYFVFTD